VGEIQRNIIKQGKRNAISRHLHAKNDKERIAGWRLDLNRILQVFNVCSRSIVSVLRLLTPDSQTELAINTHVTVSETHVTVAETRVTASETHAIVSELEHNATRTHIMVSDIHRTMVKGQEVNDSNNLSVSDTRTLFTTESPLTAA